MKKEEMTNIVCQLISDMFFLSRYNPSVPETDLRVDLGLDEIDIIALIEECEGKFNTKLTNVEDFTKFQTITEIVDCFHENMKNNENEA